MSFSSDFKPAQVCIITMPKLYTAGKINFNTETHHTCSNLKQESCHRNVDGSIKQVTIVTKICPSSAFIFICPSSAFIFICPSSAFIFILIQTDMNTKERRGVGKGRGFLPPLQGENKLFLPVGRQKRIRREKPPSTHEWCNRSRNTGRHTQMLTGTNGFLTEENIFLEEFHMHVVGQKYPACMYTCMHTCMLVLKLPLATLGLFQT